MNKSLYRLSVKSVNPNPNPRCQDLIKLEKFLLRWLHRPKGYYSLWADYAGLAISRIPGEFNRSPLGGADVSRRHPSVHRRFLSRDVAELQAISRRQRYRVFVDAGDEQRPSAGRHNGVLDVHVSADNATARPV